MKGKIGLLLAAVLSLAAVIPVAQADGGRATAAKAPAKQPPPELQCSSKVTVLLLKDEGTTNSSEVVLDYLNVNFITAAASQFSTVLAPSRLAKCHTVIVASGQSNLFYASLQPYIPNLTSWTLFPQHTLVFHGANDGGESGYWNFALPLNLTHSEEYDSYNYIANPLSPLVHGLSPFDVIDGDPASSAILNLGAVEKTKIVLQTQAPGGSGGGCNGDSCCDGNSCCSGSAKSSAKKCCNNNSTSKTGKSKCEPTVTAQPAASLPANGPQPTMVDYCYVLGRIIASTTTQEANFSTDLWAATLLWNELYLATKKPGCQPKAIPPSLPEELYPEAPPPECPNPENPQCNVE